MTDENGKTNKQCTGTIPKSKCPTDILNGQDKFKCLSNNLVSWHHTPANSEFMQNPRRNEYLLMDTVESTMENSILHEVQNANGTVTSDSTSSTTKRDFSESGLKSENVTKHPDKQQIIRKLHQIREYLKIASSLMDNMDISEDQITSYGEMEGFTKTIDDLKDSEKKLVTMLEEINSDEHVNITNEQIMENEIDTLSEHSIAPLIKKELGVNMENPNQDLDEIKNQQSDLIKLQQKAENKLRDARQIQSNLRTAQCVHNVKNISNIKDKNCLESDFDTTIRELEYRTKNLILPEISNKKIHDNIFAKVESLHNQIVDMHNANDEREQLIETLENHDVDLRSQHVELQYKLNELQNKKQQVDKLMAQLQTFGEEEVDDVGGKLRKIVTMKDQLKKLKDMLKIVKTTENTMQNTDTSVELQTICDNTLISEHFSDKDIWKPKLQDYNQTESNILKFDNDDTLVNENQPKEVNKKFKDDSRGGKPKTYLTEKLVLQAKLQPKRKEVVMGKHKASSLNLNHDVGADVKSEFNCSGNTINEAWGPLLSSQCQQNADSDRLSSDECQDALQDNHNMVSITNSHYSPSNSSKHRFGNNIHGDYVSPVEYDRIRVLSRNSERNLRSNSVPTTGYMRGSQSNIEQDSKAQVQKQLNLIKSVCDSMLEQQGTATLPLNIQQLRNNLTPSPFSEPHHFASLNVVNPPSDRPCSPGNNLQSNLNSDINYQNWLATSTIQTQSFMVNTLNQCCQMLWLQQKELSSLRNVVTMLQERMEHNLYGGQQDLTSSMQSGIQDHCSTNHYRSIPNPKLNSGSATFSLPNLNQYSTPPSNLDLNYINQNNIQNTRLLGSLNNVNINHINPHQGIEHANNILHGVNSNINHSLPNQMWNGQALNNQLPPGNRTRNNYWDNFRR